FQGLDLRVVSLRYRLRHFGTTILANSVGVDSERERQQDTSSGGQPNEVPMDLWPPVSVSLREGKASWRRVRSSVRIARFGLQWSDCVRRRRFLGLHGKSCGCSG